MLRSAFIVELNVGRNNERPVDGCWREGEELGGIGYGRLLKDWADLFLA